jgi:hypothetical protein
MVTNRSYGYQVSMGDARASPTEVAPEASEESIDSFEGCVYFS